jgi:hypothetical protein
VGFEWFFQKVRVVAEGRTFPQHVIGVPAGINDFEFGFFGEQPGRHFAAGDAVGHDHVGEEEINPGVVLRDDAEDGGVGNDIVGVCGLGLKQLPAATKNGS